MNPPAPLHQRVAKHVAMAYQGMADDGVKALVRQPPVHCDMLLKLRRQLEPVRAFPKHVHVEHLTNLCRMNANNVSWQAKCLPCATVSHHNTAATCLLVCTAYTHACGSRIVVKRSAI